MPASWTTLVYVKAEHFRSLAHYHAAVALCDGSCECPLPTCLRVLAEAPCSGFMGSLNPQWQLRTSSPSVSRSSSSRPLASPKAPHCHSSWRSAGSLVRHQGLNTLGLGP
jgi:hypothetical protein